MYGIDRLQFAGSPQSVIHDSSVLLHGSPGGILSSLEFHILLGSPAPWFERLMFLKNPWIDLIGSMGDKGEITGHQELFPYLHSDLMSTDLKRSTKTRPFFDLFH